MMQTKTAQAPVNKTWTGQKQCDLNACNVMSFAKRFMHQEYAYDYKVYFRCQKYKTSKRLRLKGKCKLWLERLVEDK